MKRKTIDAMHEMRMSVVQIVIPLVATTVAAMQIPEVRNYAQRKYYETKGKLEDIKRKVKIKCKRGA